MPLPAPLIAAFAPAIIDHFTGKGGKAAAAKIPEAVVETIAEIASEDAKHERRKASVRPALMRGSNAGLFASAIAHVGVAVFGQPFGLTPEMHAIALEAIQWTILTFAGVSGTGYAIRSGEKHRGKA